MAIQAMSVTETKIADEVQILKRPGFEAIPITLDSTAFTDGVCRAGAVSYTHLDVYKRQEADHGRVNCVGLFPLDDGKDRI